MKSEKKILDMMQDGTAVLFVSHSLAQVKRICNKAMILEGGKMIAFGDVDEVAQVYAEMTGELDELTVGQKNLVKKKNKKKKKVQAEKTGCSGVRCDLCSLCSGFCRKSGQRCGRTKKAGTGGIL